MIKKIFCVKDDKAETYGALFMCNTEGEALRGFADAANDPQMAISKHPEDYRLYRMGTFDDCSGVITPESPVRLAIASEYVKQN